MKERVKDPRIKTLVAEVAEGRQAEILEEMIETVLRFGKDKTGIADLSITARCGSCDMPQISSENTREFAKWPSSGALG